MKPTIKTTILAVALASSGIHHQAFAEEVRPTNDGQASPAIAQLAVPTKLDEKDFIGSDDGGREETGKNWQQAANLVISKLGYDAVSLRPPGGEIEGCSDTLIVVDDRVLARIPYAAPVMFSPQGDYLLLNESSADDDEHYFIVDVLGLDREEVPLQRHLFGSRHTINVRWSKDGQIIRAGDGMSEPDFSKDYPLSEILGKDVMSRPAGVNIPDKEKAEVDHQALLIQIQVVTEQLNKAEHTYNRSSGWRDVNGIQARMTRDRNRKSLIELKRQLAWSNRQLSAIASQEENDRPFFENFKLRESHFQGTTKGITAQELRILNEKKESENWKITNSEPGRITVESKDGTSSLTTRNYKIEIDPRDKLEVLNLTHTNNQGVVSTRLLHSSMEPADRFPNLPVVTVNDFYAEKDQVETPHKYSGAVTTLLEENGSISFNLDTSAEPELAGKRQAYKVSAYWNGKGFSLAKAGL